LASAAVVIEVAGGNVTYARVALAAQGLNRGGPHEAEAVLTGKPADAANFRSARKPRCATPKRAE